MGTRKRSNKVLYNEFISSLREESPGASTQLNLINSNSSRVVRVNGLNTSALTKGYKYSDGARKPFRLEAGYKPYEI
jgi:hypothetical protein